MSEAATKRPRGRPRKSLEDHILDGTYRADRHGPLPGAVGMAKKPPGVVTASARSQAKWISSIADQRAFDNGCRFNEALAEHACNFFSKHLRHSKGQWAGQPFVPNTWQAENLLYPVFGWVRPDGFRRYRRTYIEIPKKNYKSTTASGIGLYMLVGDEEGGAEVYSLGADKDQARVVHNEAINMVESSPDLADRLKINKTTGTITYPETRSFYRVLSSTPRGKHGLNIHCGIADELHEWYGNKLWNAIKYGYRARRQPLQFVITNAGDDLESVCYKQREKAVGILNGTIHDDAFFALICSVDREEAEKEIEEVRTGATHIPVAESCNPAFGDVIREEDLVSDIQDAIQAPSEMPNLLRLTYGVWCTSETPWLSMDSWSTCEAKFSADELAGRVGEAGLDLSKTEDMTSLALIFPDHSRDDTYQQLVKFWIPEETIERNRHLVDYDSWVEGGWLTPVPGRVIDYDFVQQDIARTVEPFNIRHMAYDAAYAQHIAQWAEKELGIEPFPFQQTLMQFMGPTAEYERLILAGRLEHNGNDLLTWQASHVKVKADPANNNNKRPVKPKHGDIRKIDGIVAGIMALRLAMAFRDVDPTPKTSFYETHGLEHA